MRKTFTMFESLCRILAHYKAKYKGSLFLASVLVAIILVGCASTSITMVGDNRYPPIPVNEKVLVYNSEADVNHPFEIIGIINYNNPGKFRVLTLEDAMPVIKAKARSIGANAIIIDVSRPIKSGMISTGIWVSVHAVRIRR